MAGFILPPYPEIPYSLLYWERSIKSVANSTAQDVRDSWILLKNIILRQRRDFFRSQGQPCFQLLNKSKIKASAVLKPKRKENSYTAAQNVTNPGFGQGQE